MTTFIIEDCDHGSPDFLCRRCHPELNTRGNFLGFAAAANPTPARPRDFYQPKGMSDEEWSQIKRANSIERAKRSLAALEDREDIELRPNLKSLATSLRRKIEAEAA